jgi:hypothetical protein
MNLILLLALACTAPAAHSELQVASDFPGGSAQVESLDQQARSLTIRPSSHKDTGWECWWSFRLSGITPGETIQLTVKGMDFALPRQASFSYDGKAWQHSQPGKSEKGQVTYTLKFDRDQVWLAWGPPFQLSDARALVERTVQKNVGAKAFTLAKSRGGIDIPALRWDPALPSEQGQQKKRHAIWLHSGQHAWESGARWVGAGFVDWLASDDAAARQLRESTLIVYVPIMDVDNVELGAGGKNQKPHDHNRDWSDEPVFAAVKAAQQEIIKMDEAGELALFVDLHNPAPNDAKPFFYVSPPSLHSAEAEARQTQWIKLAHQHLGKESLGLSTKTQESGPGYHPLWRQISKNWVATSVKQPVVSLTLEVSWNTPNSTQDKYQAYGRALGQTIHAFLQQPTSE